MSLKMLRPWRNLFSNFLIRPKMAIMGTTPSTMNRIIPGIRKLSKKEESNSEIGNLSIFPEGEIINKAPPYIAPMAKSESNPMSTFLKKYFFMLNILFSKLIFIGE